MRLIRRRNTYKTFVGNPYEKIQI